jgi:riboflavin kinase / FMN adenylyltransferase
VKLVRYPNSIPKDGCVATIGNFDGVHRGHLALLEQLVKEARSRGLPSVVILFEPQPREFFDPAGAPARLTPFREKIQLLKQLPIDYLICLHFNAKWAEMSAESFIQSVLIEALHVKHLILGEDFHFGKNRKGNAELLKKYFSVEVFPPVNENGERISSTAIRHSLAAGNLGSAEKGLGRSYAIAGRVKRGAGRGREWGFPTANIAVPKKGLPLSGVFFVHVNGERLKHHPGVANIGIRPTVDGSYTVLEVLLLDFDGNLYDQHLEVQFLHKLRDEIKFDNIEALKDQIKADVLAAKHFFNLK